MKNQIFELKGRLATAKSELEVVQLEASAHVSTVLLCISAFEKDITRQNVRKAKVALDRLVELQEKADALKTDIQEFQDVLGAL